MATFTQTTTATFTRATPPMDFRRWAVTARGVMSKTVTRYSPFSPTTGRDSLPARGRLVRPGAATGPALTAAVSAETASAEIVSAAAGAAAASVEDSAAAALAEEDLADFGEAASTAAGASFVWTTAFWRPDLPLLIVVNGEVLPMKATTLLMKFPGFLMALPVLAIQVVGQQPAHNREPASPKREASTKVQAVVKAQSATA